MDVRLTYKPAAAGGRVVHSLQGGGPGMRDREGRRLWISGLTRCGVERRSRVALVETDAEVTCRTCLRAMRVFGEGRE